MVSEDNLCWISHWRHQDEFCLQDPDPLLVVPMRSKESKGALIGVSPHDEHGKALIVVTSSVLLTNNEYSVCNS